MLINNVAHHRETLSERPISLPLIPKRLKHLWKIINFSSNTESYNSRRFPPFN